MQRLRRQKRQVPEPGTTYLISSSPWPRGVGWIDGELYEAKHRVTTSLRESQTRDQCAQNFAKGVAGGELVKLGLL